jgi:hypothetical protein
MLTYRRMRSRLAEAIGVTALAAALTVLLTYPIVFKIDRVARFDSGDGLWNLWNIGWVARTLVREPARVWDANIFYPHPNTLAYSENNFLAGVVAIIPYYATGNVVFAHNIVVLFGFMSAFLATWALVRYLTHDGRAALISAIIFAFCPYVFAHLAHIQLLLTAGLPLSLLMLHRFVDHRTAGRALGISAALIAQMLATGYYGMFAGLMVGVGVIFHAVSRGLWREPRYWLLTGLAAGAAVIPVALIFRPYFEVRREQGFIRGLDQAEMFSAGATDYLVSAAWAHRWMLPYLPAWEDVLFPGFVGVSLGIAGAWLGLRSRGSTFEDRPADPMKPRAPETVVFYAVLATLAFWMSLGPSGGLYALAYRLIPVFSFLRAPARFGIIVTLAVAVLAGLAVTHLLRRRPARAANLLTAGLVLLAVLDLISIPLRQVEAPPVPTAYRVLALQRWGPVAEFPFFWLRQDFHRHAYYMANSVHHWKPLVNGYSDHIPADFRQMVVPLSTFPSRAAFQILRERRTRYVIFHLNFYDRTSRARLMERLELYQQYLRPLVQTGDVWLYEITGWPPPPP